MWAFWKQLSKTFWDIYFKRLSSNTYIARASNNFDHGSGLEEWMIFTCKDSKRRKMLLVQRLSMVARPQQALIALLQVKFYARLTSVCSHIYLFYICNLLQFSTSFLVNSWLSPTRFCFIDRSNISNARLEGLTTDLHLSTAQYNGSIAIFYFLYFLVEVPANIILFHTTPRVWFTFLAVAWGFIMTLQGFSKNYTDLLLCRAFQGLAEGGLFPGVAFFFSTWYSKYQSGFRLAIFFSSVPVAGAINGFIAHAINLMDGIAGIHGWAWLFILEGLVTIVFGSLCFYVISDGPAR